jgi:phosphate-selective porin OprO/OprP
MKAFVFRPALAAVAATVAIAACPAVGAAQQPASPQQQPPPPPTRVDASGTGVTIGSGVNTLTISNRVQVRWTLDDREASDTDTTGTGLGEDDGPIGSFDVARLRLTLSGGAYRPWLRYSFQLEMSRTSGANDSKIKDAYLEIRPSGRPYRVQIGQMKAPFSLQQVTSSGRLQFVERAPTDGKFVPSRDTGVQVLGTIGSPKVGYGAGVFNGAGEALPQNNGALLYVGRVFVNPLGAYNPAEGAVEAIEKPVLHLGGGFHTGKAIRGRTPAGIVQDVDNQTAINGEAAYKTGRLFTAAEYFWMRDQQRNPIDGRDIDSRGFYLQGGYMLVPRRVEVGARWSTVDGDTTVADSGVSDIRGVVGYFWRGHDLKLQADAGQVRYGAGFASMSGRARQGLPGLGTRLVSGEALADFQLRVQMQLTF